MAASDPLQSKSDPQVVAVSQGSKWPRAMLVGTLDEASRTQTLHVLMSKAASDPFKVYASVPMLPGTSVPALGDLATGTPLVAPTDAAGAPLAPNQSLAAYAAALAYPKPVASKAVATKDAYATALRTSAAAQVKSLGKPGHLHPGAHAEPEVHHRLPSRRRRHGDLRPGSPAATSSRRAPPPRSLVIPGTYSKLVGKTKAKKSLTITSLENVVMVVPAKGAATTVGADEQMVSATAE